MSTYATRDPAPAGARRTVATETNYREAERAVDWLSDHDFPVEGVSIVGTGLRSVERVSGRVTTGRAALMGAAQGATIGLLFGLLFGLFFTNAGDFFGVVLYGLVAGIVWGSLWGAIFHYTQRGRRDFASVTQTRADRYEVQVNDIVAEEAERILKQMPRSIA
jgi:tetrahydromethanopterin S-methyltransferase subunit G